MLLASFFNFLAKLFGAHGEIIYGSQPHVLRCFGEIVVKPIRGARADVGYALFGYSLGKPVVLPFCKIAPNIDPCLFDRSV
jgi:hypothetical protein